MVKFFTTAAAIFSGLAITAAVTYLAAMLMTADPVESRYMCFNFDQKSTYITTEQWLRSSNPMFKGVTTIPGVGESVVYVPKSNLVGCIEEQ